MTVRSNFIESLVEKFEYILIGDFLLLYFNVTCVGHPFLAFRVVCID